MYTIFISNEDRVYNDVLVVIAPAVAVVDIIVNCKIHEKLVFECKLDLQQ